MTRSASGADRPNHRFRHVRVRGVITMKAFSIRLAGASLIALAAAGCTTSGIGTGQVVGQNVGATFNWTQNGGTRGTMVAQLSDGQVFQGPFFQITSESVVDYDPLWN